MRTQAAYGLLEDHLETGACDEGIEQAKNRGREVSEAVQKDLSKEDCDDREDDANYAGDEAREDRSSKRVRDARLVDCAVGSKEGKEACWSGFDYPDLK